jgi:K+-transporting ATPase A subunit
MTAATVALLVVFLGVVLASVKPLGLYMAHVMAGTPIWPLRAGAPIERLAYRVAGVNPEAEMDWKHYLWRTAGVRPAAAAGVAAAESTRVQQRLAGLLVQHRAELHHQYQLAGLLG